MPDRDGGTGGGGIGGLAERTFIALMPGGYLSPWLGRKSGGVSGLSLYRVILGLSSLTVGMAPCGPIFSVKADLGYSLVWFFWPQSLVVLFTALLCREHGVVNIALITAGC